MGLLMLAGLFGTIAYMGHFAKQETTAIVGDMMLEPTHNISEDKEIVEKNFTLLCKRCNAKLDKNNNPIYKDKHKPCMAYLQYQGFQQPVVDYFRDIYLEKYHTKYENERKQLKNKHQDLRLNFYIEPHETKVIRKWDYGNTKEKCEKMMQDSLWYDMVRHYNIVDDGMSNVEVWTLTAPPSILKQVDTIYDEVCTLEVYNKEK